MPQEDRIQQLEDALQRLVNLHEESRRLHAHLNHLMDEDRVIMAIVEASCVHEDNAYYESEHENYDSSSKAAADLDALLEEYKVTLEPDEENGDILHVLRDSKPWRSFHRTEWEWTDKDGKWSWEHNYGDRKTTLVELRKGALFVTEDGTYAVKTKYRYDEEPYQYQCILLESGQYAHFHP